MRARPTLEFETRLWALGYRSVAGLDEAGRGAWAGPVVAAAVVLPPGVSELPSDLHGIDDSKRLTAKRRETLFEAIRLRSIAWGRGIVPASVVDSVGVVPATRLAMSLALQALETPAEHLLIDYLSLGEVALPQTSLPKGDGQIMTIAAASIMAKVLRDRMMVELDGLYPGYGFAQHKGYGTQQHRSALQMLGPCPVHRLTFAPLRETELTRQYEAAWIESGGRA